MNLQFDSIQELEEFLMFSAHIGRAFATQPPVGDISPEKIALSPKRDMPRAELEAMLARNPEGLIEPALIDHGDISAETIQQNHVELVDKPKRTRRTKAEMEAARAELSGPIDAAASVATVETASTTADANPFAIAPAMQAVLDAPNQNAATLAAMAAMQNAPAEEPAVAPRVIESIEHLRACQSFIQAHGMTKYNESFRDGLNANIAAYTPEQRAQHVAILEQLAA